MVLNANHQRYGWDNEVTPTAFTLASDPEPQHISANSDAIEFLIEMWMAAKKPHLVISINASQLPLFKTTVNENGTWDVDKWCKLGDLIYVQMSLSPVGWQRENLTPNYGTILLSVFVE